MYVLIICNFGGARHQYGSVCSRNGSTAVEDKQRQKCLNSSVYFWAQLSSKFKPKILIELKFGPRIYSGLRLKQKGHIFVDIQSN